MALRNQPYIPLYVQDFLTDEKLIECSAESTGVYIRLICILHKSEEYGKLLLKQKDKQTTKHLKNFALKLLKQMPYTIEVIEKSLQELLIEGVITIEDDYLYQKRMVRDNEVSIKRSESGQKGGKKTQFASKFAKAKVKANTENENEDENEDSKKKIDAAFVAFWNAYPNKKEKQETLKRWQKLKHTLPTIETILEAIKKQIAWRNNANGEFRPEWKNPATWLNRGCWDDELKSIGGTYGNRQTAGSSRGNYGRDRVLDPKAEDYFDAVTRELEANKAAEARAGKLPT
ncbi:MAG: hypothetical protein WC332_00750 [Clostridia bacterium]|jgi:hypothetical protein